MSVSLHVDDEINNSFWDYQSENNQKYDILVEKNGVFNILWSKFEK